MSSVVLTYANEFKTGMVDRLDLQGVQSALTLQSDEAPPQVHQRSQGLGPGDPFLGM